MSIKCPTNSELEDMIARFDTKAPQDRAVFYALIELSTHRMIRSLAGKKPWESARNQIRRRKYMNYKERYDALLEEARKVARPVIHTEFTCPYCGGVASTVIRNGNISAECHCCNTSGHRNWERFTGWSEKYRRKTI